MPLMPVPTIRIRGGASLNASNDPLIVIDGIPVSNDAAQALPMQLPPLIPMILKLSLLF